MSGRKALGRGLDALIPAGTGREPGELLYLELAQIQASHLQPRKDFVKKSLEELADSIKAQGVIQPILVRAVASQPGKFELIAGERRFRAAKLAGLKQVPALVKNVTEQEALAMSLLENLQREDLNPIEEAKGLQRLIQEFNWNQEELGKKIGKDRSTIANTLRLLKLPEEIQVELEKGKITPGHGRALLALDAPNKIKLLFRKIVEEGLNVRQAEAWSRKLSELEESRPKKSKGSAESKIFLDDLERNLGRALSAKVKLIESSKNRGRIEIYFNNLQELERIIELVQRKR